MGVETGLDLDRCWPPPAAASRRSGGTLHSMVARAGFGDPGQGDRACLAPLLTEDHGAVRILR